MYLYLCVTSMENGYKTFKYFILLKKKEGSIVKLT
jgi:hypothetical protein